MLLVVVDDESQETLDVEPAVRGVRPDRAQPASSKARTVATSAARAAAKASRTTMMGVPS